MKASNLTIIALLLCIIWLLWRMVQAAEAKAVTIPEDTPKPNQFVQEETQSFEERQLRRVRQSRDEFEDRQRARKLGVQ